MILKNDAKSTFYAKKQIFCAGNIAVRRTPPIGLHVFLSIIFIVISFCNVHAESHVLVDYCPESYNPFAWNLKRHFKYSEMLEKNKKVKITFYVNNSVTVSKMSLWEHVLGNSQTECYIYLILQNNFNGKHTLRIDVAPCDKSRNNFAYCNNQVTDCFDWPGGISISQGTVRRTPPPREWWDENWTDGRDGYEYKSKWRQKYKTTTYEIFAIYNDAAYTVYLQAVVQYNIDLAAYNKAKAADPNCTRSAPKTPTPPVATSFPEILMGSLETDGTAFAIDTQKKKKL